MWPDLLPCSDRDEPECERFGPPLGSVLNKGNKLIRLLR
jgi:hypothetical protein